uniref:(northern house mosquito) hypothetical protein n=1 Tax=Culex pipiens TaxID=7175 RepID=A0A8D8E4E9_CULPI
MVRNVQHFILVRTGQAFLRVDQLVPASGSPRRPSRAVLSAVHIPGAVGGTELYLGRPSGWYLAGLTWRRFFGDCCDALDGPPRPRNRSCPWHCGHLFRRTGVYGTDSRQAE